MARLGPGDRYAAIDGRPLVVGGCSKDRDARAGRGAGGMARGYKMYAVVDGRHVILAYEIHAMSMAEQTVALSLLPRLPSQVARIVGDKIYDSTKLHSVAAACGLRLYTPLREDRVGRRRQPVRLRLLRLLGREVGRRLMHWRGEIERTFGTTTTVSFGFKGLPAWARRIHRVERWMWGKTLLHHAWLLAKRKAA
ncbi:MAG: transposase [Herbaspirillum sp.]|nr:transposase [Herbaspirillum sp.]